MKKNANLFKILLLSNIWIAGLFGSSLQLFSLNGVDDPIISPIYSFLKDGLAVLTILICSLAFPKSSLKYNKSVIYYILLVVTNIICICILRVNVINVEELKQIKTIIIYSCLLPFFISSATYIKRNEVGNAMIVSLALAMVFSLMHYGYNPYASYTLRNFGVFGNPNALAIFSLVSLIIFNELRCCRIRIVLQLIAIMNIITAMSIVAICLAVVLLVLNYRRNRLLILLVITGSFVFVIMFDSYMMYFHRVIQMLNEGASHESFSVRYADYFRAIDNIIKIDINEFYLMDGAYSTLLYNYGIFGLFLMLTWIFFATIIPLWKFGISLIFDNYYMAMNLLIFVSIFQFSVLKYPGALYMSLLIYTIYSRRSNYESNSKLN